MEINTAEEVDELKQALSGAKNASDSPIDAPTNTNPGSDDGGNPPVVPLVVPPVEKPAGAEKVQPPAGQGANPPAGENKEGAKEGAQGAAPKVDPPADENVVELSTIFGGKYASIEDVEARLKRADELETELDDARKNPKFESDQAKMLYDYSNKTGLGLAGLQQFLHVQGLTLQGEGALSDQQLRFEAFKLSPEFSGKGLSDKDLEALFMDEEVNKYGDPENTQNPPTPAQTTRARLATQAAKEVISKMQKEWSTAKPAERTPEDVASEKVRLRTTSEQALAGFKGIQTPVTATGENGEKLDAVFNFSLDKPEQLQAILDATVNPQEMWEQALTAKGVVSKDGVVDVKKFGEMAARFLYHEQMLGEVYRQGHNDGIAYKVKNSRNAAPPVDSGKGPINTPPEPKNDKEGLAEAAFKVAGRA